MSLQTRLAALVAAVGADIKAIRSRQPAGVPIPWLVDPIPTGYLEFNGQAITSGAYPKLFALFGGNLPDLTGRFLLGVNIQHDIGTIGGEFTHLLKAFEAAQKAGNTSTDTPDHTHADLSDHTAHSVPSGAFYGVSGFNGGGQTGGASARHTHAIAGVDATTAFNVTPPYRTVRWITYAE